MNRTHLRVVLVAALLGLSTMPAAAQLPMQSDPVAQLDAEAANLNAKVATQTERKVRAETELAGLNEAKARAQKHLHGHAKSLYRLTRLGLSPFANGIDAMFAHVARIERMRRMVIADSDAVAGLSKRDQILNAEIADSSREIAASQTRIRDIAARKESLAMAALATEAIPSISFAPAPRMSSSRMSYGTSMEEGTIRYHDDGPQSVAPRHVAETGFATMRGNLAMPAVGRLAGETDDGSGVHIDARFGSSVRAVEDGRVTFAGERPLSGRTVVIDHGNRYTTVYGGLDAIEVQVGDTVSRGVRLGTTGDAGGVSGMRFEVRKGTQRLNAREWLGY